jgi:hypothetical protein
MSTNWIDENSCDGTARRYEGSICGGPDDLVEFAQRRLAAGRELTGDERERYLG